MSAEEATSPLSLKVAQLMWAISHRPKLANSFHGIRIVPCMQVLALARKMMDGRSKQDILDSSYHRYAFHDSNVPKWFYEDEKRHMRQASSTSS